MTGPIPTTSSNLNQLRLLDLNYGNLWGPIDVVGSMTKLETFDISSNLFTGDVPPSIINIDRYDITAFGNCFTGTVNKIDLGTQYSDCSGTEAKGHTVIPTSVSTGTHLTPGSGSGSGSGSSNNNASSSSSTGHSRSAIIGISVCISLVVSLFVALMRYSRRKELEKKMEKDVQMNNVVIVSPVPKAGGVAGFKQPTVSTLTALEPLGAGKTETPSSVVGVPPAVGSETVNPYIAANPYVASK
ncbi:hypothetical protein HDU76_000707 [Blyttiomyces sp. JEL0837]|nr:hypothetical protein HDU76_000707 [Blyttiomyces sp. JEL0837]